MPLLFSSDRSRPLNRSGANPLALAYLDRLAAVGTVPTASQRASLITFFRNGPAAPFRAALARLFVPVWGSAAANAIDLMHPAESGTWVGTVSHAGKQVQSVARNGYLDMSWNPGAAGNTPFNVGLLAVVPVIDTGGVIMGSRAATDLLLDNFSGRAGWCPGNASSAVYSGFSGMGLRMGFGSGSDTRLARLAAGASSWTLEQTFTPTGALPNAGVLAMAFNAGGAVLHNNQPFWAMGGLSAALSDPAALAGAIALDTLITALRA